MSTTVLEQPTQDTLRDVIISTSKAIKEEPTQAEAVFSAQSTLRDGFLSEGTIRDFSFKIDEPESLGGTNQGANPVEYVLAALGSCQQIVVKAYASVLGVEVEEVKVEAHGNLDLHGFFNIDEHTRPGFTGVEFITTITTSETDEEKLEQLRFFADNRCPVLDIIQNEVPVKGHIEFK